MVNYDKDDPVTGYIAFERIVDRLLEEARESHVIRERQGDLLGDIRKLEGTLREMTVELKRVQAQLTKREAGGDALRELYEAAANVLRATNRALGRTGRPRYKPAEDVAQDVVAARGGLRKALEGAAPHVDLIPF